MNSLMKKGLEFSLILFGLFLAISLTATNLALFLICVSTIILLFQKELSPKWELPFSIAFIGLFFFWASSTIWFSQGKVTLNSLKSFSKVWNFLPYLILPLAAGVVRDKTENILRWTLFTAALVIGLGAIQYWWDVHYFFEGWFNKGLLVKGKRLYGFQSYPLHTAGLYTVLYILSLTLALFSSQKKGWIFSSLLLGLGIFLTGSRSYYLSMVLATSILLALKGWKFFVSGMLVGFILLCALMISEPYIKERVKTMNPYQTNEAGRQRFYAWRSALLMIRDHPWKGVGYRNWGENVTLYAAQFPEWKMDPAVKGHAHNSFLTVASETGIPGLFLFLGFWFALLREEVIALFRSQRETYSYTLSCATTVSILSLLAAAFFEHNLLTATVSLAISFLVGVRRANKSET
ncbi:MAG: O-antigen ligase family protein [Elusimicrobia bacterium]|nr:O-antigen ligase family protein [Elusimicrobiota bacterium]